MAGKVREVRNVINLADGQHSSIETVAVPNLQDKRTDVTDTNSEKSLLSKRTFQNSIIIWLDTNHTSVDREYRNSIVQLQNIVDPNYTFDDLEKCVDFIIKTKITRLFIIVSDTLGPLLLPRIKAATQVDSIYILSDKEPLDKNWTKQSMNVKGVFTQIDQLCEMVKNDTRQYDENLIPISVVSSTSTNIDQLDQSFMYSEILKEILLEMDYTSKAKKDFVKFCREQFSSNSPEQDVIDEFEKYYPHPTPKNQSEKESASPLWWYTRNCFIYQMLNNALRTQQTETIINMGFLIRDIHRQIEEIHCSSLIREPLNVYRGQCMAIAEFEKIKGNPGGLLSFNSFLSTSTERNVAMGFAYANANDPNVVAILFCMRIDPSCLCAPLGNEISFFKGLEKEVLLSMHTIFRIGTTTKLNSHIWEIQLELTKNDDQEFKSLTNYIRKEIGVGVGWDRLGSLLTKMGEYDKAQKIYETLFGLTRSDDRRMFAHLHNQLGYIIKQKGDLSKAMEHYEKALEVQKESLPSLHIDFATTYSNMGSVYQSMEDHTTALSFYQKALEIKLRASSLKDASLATTYSNIGSVYDSMGDYPKAQTFYEKTLEIQETSLPAHHPSLATTYNNIGRIYRSMEDYPTALYFYQKTCAIFEKSLPPTHPSLATAYNNVGFACDLTGDYDAALEFYRKTIGIKLQSLPANHRSLATTYNNMAHVYKSKREYETALSYFQKALDIEQSSLPAGHQDVLELKQQVSQMKTKLNTR